MNSIITIGREFGSGGRELGRRLAEKLGIEYYDNEIIEEIAKHTSLSEEYIQSVTERRPHRLFPIHIGRSFVYLKDHAFEDSNTVFQTQCSIIRDLAKKSDCVIIGRCAEYVLKDYAPYRIFVYADMDSKIKRCKEKGAEHEHFSDKEMERHILEVDKRRSEYYAFYTAMTWGEKAHYDLCVNTSKINIKELSIKLADFIRKQDAKIKI